MRAPLSNGREDATREITKELSSAAEELRKVYTEKLPARERQGILERLQNSITISRERNELVLQGSSEDKFNRNLGPFLAEYEGVISRAWRQSESDAKRKSWLSSVKENHPVIYGAASVAAGTTAASVLVAAVVKVALPVYDVQASGFGKPLSDIDFSSLHDFVESTKDFVAHYWDRAGWRINSSVDFSKPYLDVIVPTAWLGSAAGFTAWAFGAARRRFNKARKRGFYNEVDHQSAAYAEDIVSGKITYESRVGRE